MALNFPTNPSLNDTYTYQGTTYVWDGEKWDGSQPFIVNTANIVDGAVTTAKIDIPGGSVVGYQQGLWTPYFDGSSGSPSIDYGVQHGEFSRVGNLVTITCRIDVATMFSNGGGSVVVRGLPYASSASNQARALGACYASGWVSSFNPTTSLITKGQAEFYLNYLNSSNESGGTPVSAFSSGLNLFTTVSYLTDDTTWTPINGATVS